MPIESGEFRLSPDGAVVLTVRAGIDDCLNGSVFALPSTGNAPDRVTSRKAGRCMDDYLIIGAGLVGLATARALRERVPDARITMLEKAADVATGQSGHNSGVIHAGIYY